MLSTDIAPPTLPDHAWLPINRCNLPAVILGSLSFQRHPTELKIDGVEELHHDLFERLDRLHLAHQRAQVFRDYMTVVFRLERPEELGWSEGCGGRIKATWARVLRGWAFDANGREAAVLKGWVESRFGLLPRHHGSPLREPGDQAWQRYEEMRASGLYGANALEAQLDLVYAYCQYEFACQRADRQAPPGHATLYRGVNRVDGHERLSGTGRRQVLLFNNLASFSSNRERADEFGDRIVEVSVPTPKILCYCHLLPGLLAGEDEYLVIGGAYEAYLT